MKTWPTAVISERTTFTVDAGSGSYRIDTHGTTNHPTLTLERRIYIYNNIKCFRAPI